MKKQAKEYFDKQGNFSNLCGVCAINNLLEGEFASENYLNQICHRLSEDLINPHKHVFGGDYDVNVLMIALDQLGYSCEWIDSRVDLDSENVHEQSNQQFVGYLINKELQKKFYHSLFGFSARHWICLRKCFINNKFNYFEFDSKEQHKSEISLVRYLKSERKNNSHIIRVTAKNSQKQLK